MPRYVILEHDYPETHWDFMLEAEEELRTWRLPSAPALGKSMFAEALANHRKAYLDYEGPVSGGRGVVRRWDSGEYYRDVDTPGRLVVLLRGGRVDGRVELRNEPNGDWRFQLTEINHQGISPP